MGYGDIRNETAKKMAHEPDLMCRAHGCPMKWSVDPGHLCSYHAWENPQLWHHISERLNQNGPWLLVSKRNSAR